MKKSGFTLTELLVSVAVLGLFLVAVFQLFRTTQQSGELLRWKTQSQMKIRKFFQDYLIPDLKRASYPSEIHEDRTLINGGSPPTDDMKLQYLSMSGTDEIKISHLGNGTIIMKWQINHPGIALSTTTESAKSAICTVRAYKKFGDYVNVLTYERVGNIDDLKDIDERVVLTDVEYVTITHTDKYTPAEIALMNTIPNSPTNQQLPSTDPDYFHDWQNNGTINIEIGVTYDYRVRVLFGKGRKFRTRARMSVSVDVQIIPKSSIN